VGPASGPGQSRQHIGDVDIVPVPRRAVGDVAVADRRGWRRRRPGTPRVRRSSNLQKLQPAACRRDTRWRLLVLGAARGRGCRRAAEHEALGRQQCLRQTPKEFSGLSLSFLPKNKQCLKRAPSECVCIIIKK